MSDEGTLRFLRELDEGTDWEPVGEMSDVRTEDNSVAGLSEGGSVLSIDDFRGDLDGPETADGILSCVGDMVKEGDVEDILVIVNTKDDDQLLFTTMERNDIIIGCLEVAKLNWHQTQIYLQNSEEE